MSSRNRFYIGKRKTEDLEHLEEWISDRIPLPPKGTMCESDNHETAKFTEDDEAVPVLATGHLYYIKDGHVCYTYVCDDCLERKVSETYLADNTYPTTKDGHAVSPKHCS